MRFPARILFPLSCLLVAGVALPGCNRSSGSSSGGGRPALEYGAPTFQVAEVGGTVTIAVQRGGGTAGAVTVDYATSDGSATEPADYTAASGTLSWADGDAADKTFSVAIADDALVEGDEFLNLTLSNPTGGAEIGSRASAVLTILDDDTPSPGALQFDRAAYSVGEGAGSVTIPVRRLGGASGAITVDYATSDLTASAPADYLAASGTLSWADGDAADKTFSLIIVDDNLVEAAETVTLTLSNPSGGATLGAPSGADLVILDDDSPPPAPTGLTAIGGTSEITLDWNPVTGATSYNLYWDTSPGVSTGSNRIPGVSHPYVHSSRINGTSCYYGVTALDGATESAVSAEAFARPIAAPAIAAVSGTGQVTIDWAPAAGATSYDLYYSPTSPVTKATGRLEAGVTAPYVHGNLVSGTTIYYRLAGRNAIGGGAESVLSPEVSATPTGPSGFPDPSFCGQGYVVHDGAAGGGANDSGERVTTDTAGRILVAGSSYSAAGDDDMVIWRFNDDCSLDTSFNGRGWVTHDGAAGGSGGADAAEGIAVDSQGRILATGYSLNAASNLDMTVWRYMPDGSLDRTFGGLGFVAHDSAAGGNGEDRGQEILLDSLGRIIVGGSSAGSMGHDMAIWRYDENGSPDPTFNGQGYVTHDLGTPWDVAFGLALDSQGRIVTSGFTGFGQALDMATWRFNADGSLDTTFNGQGWVTHDNAAGGNGWDESRAVAVDALDRIIAAGSSQSGTRWDVTIWRLNEDGTFDTTFGGQGWVVYDGTGGGDDAALDVAIDPAGRILATGSSDGPTGTDLATWRLKADGSLDASFNGVGYVTFDGLPSGGGFEEWTSIHLDALGRILLTGRSNGFGGAFDMVLFRYL